MLTIFIKELGLVQCIAKQISPKNLHKMNLTSPLCLGEFMLVRKGSQIRKLYDGSIQNMHLNARTDLNKFKYASEMIKLILETQFPEKPSPLLFQLLKVYLKQLMACDSTPALMLSFKLKLLRHDGLFFPMQQCSSCEKEEYTHFCEGERLCNNCKTPHSIMLPKKMWDIIDILLIEKDFQKIIDTKIPEKFESALFSALNY